MKIRPIQPEDESILWELQYFASLMDEEGESKESLYSHPYVARYVKNWGRPGDFGFVATDQTNDKVVGAVWCRQLSGEEKGFGYVDKNMPELSIAVFPEYRHKGVGTTLLKELLRCAGRTAQAISLAVRSTNKALKLYEKMGFARIPGKDFLNRSGVLSYVMIYLPKNVSFGFDENGHDR